MACVGNKKDQLNDSIDRFLGVGLRPLQLLCALQESESASHKQCYKKLEAEIHDQF